MPEITPEEKLLNVIKKVQGKIRLKKELRIFTKINIVLICLILVILIVFIIDVFTFNYKNVELNVDLPEERIEILPVTSDAGEMADDEDIDKVVKEDVPKKDIAKDLTLLGIIEGEVNQAIIEDKEAKKTFFLYKGDTLGEFKIYDIKEGSVTLDYKGEKIELKM
jgi:cell division protein FtsL